MGKQRVGVFGGTFDPPHNGHLSIALEARARLDLDVVLMVVANDPWQKTSDAEVTPELIRLRMVEQALVGIDGVEASTLEIDRGGESYMADTLLSLRVANPEAELFMLIGSDAAAGLLSWHEPDEVRDLATTVVVDRGGRGGGRPPADWPFEIVGAPALDISSSDLRNRFRTGQPVRALMPRAVADLVDELQLYRSPQS